MFTIGCHLSVSKGYEHMGKEAVSIGANTFQFFSRNPRGGKIKKLDTKDITNFNEFASNNNIEVILAHAPYTINAASKSEKVRTFANIAMKEDLERLNYLPNNLYNFHPGSHVKQGVKLGTNFIIETLNDVITEDQKTTILLETMAGKGTEIGKSFEELNNIIENVDNNEKLGVCLDTCHIYDAGYDIVNDLDGVIDTFDSVIGLKRLYAIHLNDSKFGYKSHKDRHAKIGEGKIGIEALVSVINHPKFKSLPFYLETPNDIEGYKDEIELLKTHYI
ncbi:MAG: deoxyribonuclease IV [Methanobacteriaceae archaeon]|nr:deoxyribonuclease IV [Methanobacteriaceae archaeon]